MTAPNVLCGYIFAWCASDDAVENQLMIEGQLADFRARFQDPRKGAINIHGALRGKTSRGQPGVVNI